MADGINKNLNSDNIINLISSDSFLSLDKDTQNKIIDNVNIDKEKDGGIIGKFVGFRTSNAAINIAFIFGFLFFILIVVAVVQKDYELTKILIPVVTMSLGYIFGNGNKK